MKKFLPIGEVANQIGVSVPTLRRWDRKLKTVFLISNIVLFYGDNELRCFLLSLISFSFLSCS